MALELDSSGDLKKDFVDLYEKTIYSIGMILERKNPREDYKRFREMVSALEEADTARQHLRAKLSKFY